MAQPPEFYLNLLKELVEFQNEIREENRFHLKSAHVVREVFEYFKTNGTIILSKGASLFRARYDSEFSHRPIPVEQMSAPPPGKRRSGRLNPEGIACLYCATDELTAVSEIRPWAGRKVTVAKGEVQKDLKIVDFNFQLGSVNQQYESQNQQFFEISVNSFFSARFAPENLVGYLPSQYLGEYFKINGYDGIKYWSSLSKTGSNIAIFEEENVKFINSKHIQIQEVKYELIDLGSDIDA